MALAAVFLWSTVATAFKLGLADFSPLQLLFGAACVSTVVFWVAIALRGQWRITHSEIPKIAGIGLLNPTLYYVVLFEAYDRLPAQVAQPLNYSWAIVLALLAVPVLKQALPGRSIVGMFVGYVGVVIVLTQGQFGIPPGTDGLGVTLALLSTLIWATYWLVSVRVNMDGLRLLTWSFSFSLLPLGLLVSFTDIPEPPATTSILSLVWVGVVEMGVTFLLWQTALNTTNHAGRLSQLIFLSPFLSLVFIHYLLGEAIHVTSVIGLLVIVVGLLVTRVPETGTKDP